MTRSAKPAESTFNFSQYFSLIQTFTVMVRVDWKSLGKNEAHDRMVQRDHICDFQNIYVGVGVEVNPEFMRSESESKLIQSS